MPLKPASNAPDVLTHQPLADLLWQAPIALMVLRGPSFRVEQVNDYSLALWGCLHEEVLRQPFLELFPTLADQGLQRILQEVYTTGQRVSVPGVALTLHRADGPRTRYLNLTNDPLLAPDGSVDGILCFGVDVTECRRTEEAHRYRTALLEAHNEATEDGILIVDTQGVILSWNHRFCAIWNMPREIMASADDKAALNFAKDQLVNPSQFIEKVTYLYAHPDRSSMDELFFLDGKVVERHGYPIKGSDGSFYGWSWVFRDITARKEVEHALKRKRDELRELADAMPQLVWIADRAGHVVFYNRRVSEFSGATRQADGEWTWEGMVHPDDLAASGAAWRTAIDTGQVYQIEHRIRMKEGHYKWHLSRAYPFRDEQGAIIKWFGTATDIDDQKRSLEIMEREVEARTRELAEANRDLERSNQELEQFAFVTSHDLQEPLRKIQTFASLLSTRISAQLNEEALGYLNKMQRASIRMSTLINDLLNFSRLQQQAAFRPADLNLILEDVRHDFDLLAEQKGAVLVIERLPVVEGNPLQLHQLFANLVGNALKFTSPGRQPRIHLQSERLDPRAVAQHPGLKPGKTYHRLSISDNGIGFPQQYADKVFEIFQRLNARTEYEGTGIGLALCHKIVRNHQGIIYAESEEGRGATFYVILPGAECAI